MRRLALATLAFCLLAWSAPCQESLAEPPVKPEPFDGDAAKPAPGVLVAQPHEKSDLDSSVTILAGSVATTSGERTGITAPFVFIGVTTRLADADMATRLRVEVALTGLPNENVKLEDPKSFRAVEFDVGAMQPLPFGLRFSVFGVFGASTVLSREQPGTLKRAFGGLRIDGPVGGLALGLGTDQRLDVDGYYSAALMIRGGVRLAEAKGVGLWLVGDASISLVNYGPSVTHDLVRVGVALGGRR